VPATLNTKTDAVFGQLTNVDVTALLLVDIGNAGHEIQPITAANVLAGEFTVAFAPAPAARAHQLASAALKRTDNVGAVTHAVAI
jgi:hypothetical protein